MNKTALIIALTGIQLCAHALMVSKPYYPKPMVEGNRRVDELIEWNKNHPGEMPPLTEQEKYEFFIKEGVPVPGSGAQVIQSNKAFNLSSEQASVFAKFNTDQRVKGFHEEDSKTAKFLLDLPVIADKEYNERKNLAYDPYDTHLYEIKSNLKMNYDYKGVPSNLATKVIGYSPESSFIQNGWAGAVEFFVPSFGDVCAYHEVNISLTKSTTSIPKDIATYLVNNKITTLSAVGSDKSGYVYQVEWWDSKFKKVLECASIKYSQERKNSVIELAKKIDSN